MPDANTDDHGGDMTRKPNGRLVSGSEHSREMSALAELEAFIASVNQGPVVIFRWRIEPECWPVEQVTENVKQFGYEADEFLSGRVSWPGITHPDDAPRLEQEVSGFLAAGRDEFGQEYRLFTKSGGIRWVEDHNRVIRDIDGTPTHIQGVVMDITARRKAGRHRADQENRLRQLAAKLAKAQDREQKRIAEGLHDDVAQLLTACMMKMRTAASLTDPHRARNMYSEAECMIREVTEKVRDLSFELGSSTLHRLGLVQGVQELCEQMERRYDVHFVIESGLDVAHVDEARATVLFKSARELLFNVVKHADVEQARVSVGYQDGCVILAVEDEGKGFSALTGGDYATKVSHGLGLFGIRERLRDIGGSLDIESEPNVRTRVTLTMPYIPDPLSPLVG